MIVTMRGLTQDQQNVLLALANRGAMKRGRTRSSYVTGEGGKAFPLRTVRALARMQLLTISADESSVEPNEAGTQLLDVGQVEIPDGEADTTN